MTESPPPRPIPIPILLLKTRSTPTDAYQNYFTSSSSSAFTPTFLPVLTHRRNPNSLSHISSLLHSQSLTNTYDGLIFTSQRAVEAFSSCVHDTHCSLFAPSSSSSSSSSSSPPPPPPISSSSSTHANDNNNDNDNHNKPVLEFPLYVVGPATGALLNPIIAPLRDILGKSQFNPVILGQECGNGEALANFLLKEYNGGDEARSGEGQRKQRRKRKLLFLVGEQRRDVIPRTLMDEALGEYRVEVTEMEVYRTDVSAEFERDLSAAIKQLEEEEKQQPADYRTRRVAVIVVFSPQGCETMLKVLGWLGSGGGGGDERERSGWERRLWRDGERGQDKITNKTLRYVVATIGPTTRDFLRDKFGFEPDACAKKPSPEGVALAVADFLENAKGVR